MKTYDNVHLIPAISRWIIYRRLCWLRWIDLRLYLATDSTREAIKRLEDQL